MSHSQNDSANQPRDIALIKRELSLDLDGSKMSVDGDVSISSNKQIIQIPSTPNTPNFTHTSGNTSQSMTPSEFGYQHLNRASGAVSLESSPKSAYENLEQSFSSYDGGNSAGVSRLSVSTPKGGLTKITSPIRSTINITYNLKSPLKSTTHENVFFSNSIGTIEKQPILQSDYELVNVTTVDQAANNKKPLLETSFDENMVYEQVKFFKGAITEVNSLLDNGNDSGGASGSNNTIMDQQVVPHLEINEERNQSKECQVDDDVVQEEVNSNVVPDCEYNNSNTEGKRKYMDSDDVPMFDQEIDIQDSLELDQNISLYENVELRKPASVYENVDMQLLRSTTTITADSLESGDTTPQKPSNFMVRQLANKFETSPVDQMQPFDFSKPFSRKLDNNRNSPCFIKAKNNKQLHKSAKITRSLDENAFVREFGHTIKLDGVVNKGSQQIGGDELDGRRMSLDFIRPKSLNQPKRLPDLDDVEAEICKSDNGGGSVNANKLKLDLTITPKYDVKITPTTENPISLIQHNVNMDQKFQDDEKNMSSLSSIKGLANCKLDRERIEKIKEERRHQLNEKFRSESFRANSGDANEYTKTKSKSKIELRDLKDATDHKAESLRYKSKSRTDVRSYSRGDISDLHHGLDEHVVTTIGLISSGVGGTQRIRRISDEKNQNDCIDNWTNDTKMGDVMTSSGGAGIKGRKYSDKKDMDFIVGGSVVGRDRDSFSVNVTSSRSSLSSQ